MFSLTYFCTEHRYRNSSSSLFGKRNCQRALPFHVFLEQVCNLSIHNCRFSFPSGTLLFARLACMHGSLPSEVKHLFSLWQSSRSWACRARSFYENSLLGMHHNAPFWEYRRYYPWRKQSLRSSSLYIFPHSGVIFYSISEKSQRPNDLCLKFVTYSLPMSIRAQ